MAPRILLLDIETAPSLAWVWGKYDQNVIAFEEDWYLLSFAYQWLGESRVYFKGLPDYPNYTRDKRNDKLLVTDLRALLDAADVVIAHNGDRFDVKKSNARFLYHSLLPPSPYKTIDTLKAAKLYFRFDGNSLNDIVRYLKVGAKLPNTGFDLWSRCMKGDPSAWKMMKEYNIHDIKLLGIVYGRMKAWIKNHPNLSLYTKPESCCPTCQSKRIQKRGFSYLVKTVKQRFTCLDCGAWWTGKYIRQKK